MKTQLVCQPNMRTSANIRLTGMAGDHVTTIVTVRKCLPWRASAWARWRTGARAPSQGTQGVVMVHVGINTHELTQMSSQVTAATQIYYIFFITFRPLTSTSAFSGFGGNQRPFFVSGSRRLPRWPGEIGSQRQIDRII